jgi:hypothetical protein
MYFLPDFSLTFKNLDLRKVSNSILSKNFDLLIGIFKRLIETVSPVDTAEFMLESSLKHYIPKEITPEISAYLSRITLRSLFGLPSIGISSRDKDAIRKLKGSISWISKNKIDVTESIRKMREG